jgi:hypothetical protein
MVGPESVGKVCDCGQVKAQRLQACHVREDVPWCAIQHRFAVVQHDDATCIESFLHQVRDGDDCEAFTMELGHQGACCAAAGRIEHCGDFVEDDASRAHG